MSKQLKYKLKKTLKNAEFVHADLEYHQELFTEAKTEFKKEVDRLLSKLPAEEQERLREIVERKISEEIAQKLGAAAEREEKEEETEVTESNCMDLIATDIEPENQGPEEKVNLEKSKLIELKRLFRKIAELTHPDKLAASGLSKQETARLEKVFKRALQAYNDDNWYVVYSIALDLQLPLDVESEDYIDWIDEDIRKTLSNISRIGNTVAWMWYVGDEASKSYALRSYFEQVYGYVYPGL
jgi:hypothetical protein